MPNLQSSDLLDYFNNRQSQLLQFVRELVEIESPSGDTEGSRKIVSVLAAAANKLTVVDSIEKVASADCGEHLIVRAFSDSPEKPILLLGHTDTVHPLGSLAARPFRIEGGRVFGPGIFDMKSGCALMFEALRALENFKIKPPRPIVILLSCDEEIGSQTGRQIVEREAAKAEFCLVVEPSAPGGKLKTGRKGTSNYLLRVRGVPAHAGLEPEKGASAILELVGQILRIHALNQPEIGTTVNVCTIAGGTATNVIPDKAECSIDVRFTSMSEALRVENEVKHLKPLDQRVSLEILGEINRPPLERTRQSVALYQKALAVAATFDYELGETQVGGASDGNFVAALGVPVLDGLGIQGDGAHTHHEHILLSDISKRAVLITSLIT